MPATTVDRTPVPTPSPSRTDCQCLHRCRHYSYTISDPEERSLQLLNCLWIQRPHRLSNLLLYRRLPHLPRQRPYPLSTQLLNRLSIQRPHRLLNQLQEYLCPFVHRGYNKERSICTSNIINNKCRFRERGCRYKIVIVGQGAGTEHD
jgi:hypothetical protein